MYKFDGNNLTNLENGKSVIIGDKLDLENPKINHYSPCNGGYSL